jgi:hypothetical protein
VTHWLRCSAEEYRRWIAHFLFNLSTGGRERARVLLRAKMWGVDGQERGRRALAPRDQVLIYLAAPDAEFIGCAELATAVHRWTHAEGQAFPGDSPCGVVLASVEEWDPPVPMAAVVRRIDPTGSNPVVQENAAAGFRTAVVEITGDEYEAAVAVGRDDRLS